MDTSQFGQDNGDGDIYFDEQASDTEEDEASNEPQEGGNLNRRNNNMTVTKDLYEDMTDSDDSDTEEE
jgi:hypothetical protein